MPCFLCENKLSKSSGGRRLKIGLCPLLFSMEVSIQNFDSGVEFVELDRKRGFLYNISNKSSNAFGNQTVWFRGRDTANVLAKERKNVLHYMEVF